MRRLLTAWLFFTALLAGGLLFARLVAPGADLRSDLPRYRIYRHGELVDEPTELHAWWRDDVVAFLLGCSFTFESALLQAGVPVRHPFRMWLK